VPEEGLIDQAVCPSYPPSIIKARAIAICGIVRAEVIRGLSILAKRHKSMLFLIFSRTSQLTQSCGARLPIWPGDWIEMDLFCL